MTQTTPLLLVAATLALASATVASAQATMPTAPVSGWTFNGTLSDQFGDNHGTAIGDPIAFTSSAPFAGNQSLDLRGTTGAVDFGNPANLQITSAITVSLWFNFTSSGGYLFNKWVADTTIRRSWAIRDAGNGVITFMLSGDGFFNTSRKDYRIPSSIRLNDGEWHHIAFTFESNDLRIYLNGSEVTSPNKIEDSTVNTLYNNSASVVAGSQSNNTSSFSGLLAEHAIWDRVLSADEIAWLSQNSLAAIPEPSTYAALIGLSVLGLALVRRRSRK